MNNELELKIRRVMTFYDGTSHERQKKTIQRHVCSELVRKTEFALRGFRKILKPYSDFQKVCLLYAMIMCEGTYDYSKKRAYTHRYISALRDRTAVCSGYAELMLLLVGELTDYDVVCVTGATSTNSVPLHVWNILEIDGQYFHWDITWDLGKQEPHYFLKSDTEMKSRTWIRDAFPQCPAAFTGKIYRNEEALNKLRRYYRKLEDAFFKTGDFLVDE